MLTKLDQLQFVQAVPARPAQAYERQCLPPPPSDGPSGSGVAPPHLSGCYEIVVMSPHTYAPGSVHDNTGAPQDYLGVFILNAVAETGNTLVTPSGWTLKDTNSRDGFLFGWVWDVAGNIVINDSAGNVVKRLQGGTIYLERDSNLDDAFFSTGYAGVSDWRGETGGYVSGSDCTSSSGHTCAPFAFLAYSAVQQLYSVDSVEAQLGHRTDPTAAWMQFDEHAVYMIPAVECF